MTELQTYTGGVLGLEGRPGVPADKIVVVSPGVAAIAPAYLAPGTAKGASANAAIAVAGGLVGVSLSRAATSAAVPLLRQLRRLKRQGVEIFPISARTASELSFPQGHPRPNILYVRHPVQGRRYYPVASYHHFVFEHKTREAIRLLASLGATAIEVDHERGWSGKFAANLSLPLKPTGSVAGSKASRGRILFSANLDGRRSPAVPDDLVWFPHEPLWQEIAELRINGGLKGFTLELEYNDNFGVSAELKTKLAGKGPLELGGSFQTHRKTKWTFQGTFRDYRSYRPRRKVQHAVEDRALPIRSPASKPTEELSELRKADLYAIAAELGVPGRSRMSKAELVAAVGSKA